MQETQALPNVVFVRLDRLQRGKTVNKNGLSNETTY